MFRNRQYHIDGAKASTLPPAARNLFEKRFLDFQKLLKKVTGENNICKTREVEIGL